MPRTSDRQILLGVINQLELKVAEKRLEILQDDSGYESMDSILSQDYIYISPVTPASPASPPTDGGSISDSESSISSTDLKDEQAANYRRLLDAIRSLRDEVMRARVLNHIIVPPLRASQIHLLDHFAEFRPHLFRKKVRVDPEVFDCILNQISGDPIFQSRSNNPQLPIALQLAIFLNRVGHYGNAVSPEDVSQWAGVSVGSVVNCTNRVIVSLLNQHDNFMEMPTAGEEDVRLARAFVEKKTCTEWSGGVFAVDGSTFNLFEKPSFYGDTFADRKGRYSLNCQVRSTYTAVTRL